MSFLSTSGPQQYSFMQNAYLVGTIVSVLAAIVESDLDELAGLPKDHVYFGHLHPLKRQLLQTAFERSRDKPNTRLAQLRKAHPKWHDDLALLSASTDPVGGVCTPWVAAV